MIRISTEPVNGIIIEDTVDDRIVVSEDVSLVDCDKKYYEYIKDSLYVICDMLGWNNSKHRKYGFKIEVTEDKENE